MQIFTFNFRQLKLKKQWHKYVGTTFHVQMLTFLGNIMFRITDVTDCGNYAEWNETGNN